MILELFSKIKILPGTFDLSGEQTRSIMKQVRKGDILLKGYTRYLDSYLRNGIYHHAGIYIGKGFMVCMSEEGVEPIDLIEFCRCDKIAVLRLESCNERSDIIERSLRRCEQFIEATLEYVCTFDVIDHRFYSLELIGMVYKELGFSRTNKKLTDESFLQNKYLRLIYGNKVRIL